MKHRLHLRFACNAAILLPLTAASHAAPATQPAIELHWSNDQIGKSPSGQDFHGRFLNKPVTVSAANLPTHDALAVSVDLFIMVSWDGSVPIPAAGKRLNDGPDYLSIDLQAGPTLLYTTFSNNPVNDPGFISYDKSQNFPSQVPGDHFDAQTGSDEHNTLGYNFPFPGPPQPVPMDAVYRLHFVVPHHGNDVALQLTGMGLSSLTDENWGVQSVTIHPLLAKDLPSLDSDTLAKAFAAALDRGGVDQADAFTVLTSGVDRTTAWIEKNVQPQTTDPEAMKTLTADLEKPDAMPGGQDAAAPAFADLQPQAEVWIRDLRRNAPDPVRHRCDWLLQQIGVTSIESEDVRRVMLATRVLEIIGTPKALALRHRLVGL